MEDIGLNAPLTVLSACAGIGCLDLGFQRAGCRIVGQIEIDPFCQRVLQKHWPHVWRYGDLRELVKHERATEFIFNGCGVNSIDILTGGIPCQPASVAGKRGGTKDDRWLWQEFLSLVSATQPLYVCAENPPDVLSLDVDGVRFREWITLQLQARGYEVFPLMLSAESVGAPHQRERLWILAYKRSWLPVADTGSQRCGEARRLRYSAQSVPRWRGQELANPERSESSQRFNLDLQRRRSREAEQARLGGCELDHPTGARFPEPGSSGLRESETEASEEIQHRPQFTGSSMGRELGDTYGQGLAQILRQSGDLGSEFAPFERTSWPMGQSPLQWEWEPPRIVSFESEMGIDAHGHAGGLARWSRWRRAGVKAIGNGAVPQIAEILARTIIRFHRYRTQNQNTKETK